MAVPTEVRKPIWQAASHHSRRLITFVPASNTDWPECPVPTLPPPVISGVTWQAREVDEKAGSRTISCQQRPGHILKGTWFDPGLDVVWLNHDCSMPLLNCPDCGGQGWDYREHCVQELVQQNASGRLLFNSDMMQKGFCFRAMAALPGPIQVVLASFPMHLTARELQQSGLGADFVTENFAVVRINDTDRVRQFAERLRLFEKWVTEFHATTWSDDVPDDFPGGLGCMGSLAELAWPYTARPAIDFWTQYVASKWADACDANPRLATVSPGTLTGSGTSWRPVEKVLPDPPAPAFDLVYVFYLCGHHHDLDLEHCYIGVGTPDDPL